MAKENTLDLESVSANFKDKNNPLTTIKIVGKNLSYLGHTYDVDKINIQLEEKREKFIRISTELSKACLDETENINVTFSPFNGAETTALNSKLTVATDILPIGTPEQVELLYNNKHAKALYLIDKLERGHSYSGVLLKLGYLGAILMWDIEDIQKGKIESCIFLDKDGNKVLGENSLPAGIEIRYVVQGKKKIHRQFSCSYPDLPREIKKSSVTIDALYIRGSHGLVSMTEFFDEYRTYVKMVREDGIIVSDATESNLLWNMKDLYKGITKFQLNENDQFGYAGKEAKIKLSRSQDARQGHINILTKS